MSTGAFALHRTSQHGLGGATAYPFTLATGAGVLVLTALSAAYLPARRAAAVDPTTALRHE